MKPRIVLVFAFLMNIVVWFSIYEMYNIIKTSKEQLKIDPNSLQNMSKEQIIDLIERKQTSAVHFPIFYVILLVASTSAITGALISYYFISKHRYNITLAKSLLELLPNEEYSILQYLVDRDFVFQSEISEKIGKVKAHRIITRLETRGVVERIRHGKTYIIRIKPQYKKILKVLSGNTNN